MSSPRRPEGEAMSNRQRGVIAVFDAGEDARRAIADLRRGGGSAGEITLFGGPEALRRCGLLPAEGGRTDDLDRALGRGALLIVVPVGDPTAEKRISLALLKHSRDPVQIREFNPPPSRDEEK
jgi:hypothetical protein